MPRIAQPLHPDIPLSNATLRAIAVQALRKSPLRRLRTPQRPPSDTSHDGSISQDAARGCDRPTTHNLIKDEEHGQVPQHVPVSAPTETAERFGSADEMRVEAVAPVVALPTPPVTSFASIRAVMAQDEDILANVVVDAILAYLELPPEERPRSPRRWFKIVMERLARREAHRHAWHLGMLLPAAPSAESEDEEADCSEDLVVDNLTPEAIVSAEELRHQMETIWGTSQEEQQLLTAVLSETVRELAEETGAKPDTLHRRATTRRAWLRMVLPGIGYDLPRPL